MKPEMTAKDAVALLKEFSTNKLQAWVDGGWGVDALIGHQTRPHEDLDIALQHKDVHKLKWVLGMQGYRETEQSDGRETSFVMADDKGHRVDVHTFTFDSEGNNIFGVAYKPEHLTGEGSIGGFPVACIPPDVMMEFKTGYDIDEDDYHDVQVLSEKFGLPVPDVYHKFTKKRPRKAAVAAAKPAAPAHTHLIKAATAVIKSVKINDYYLADVGAAVRSAEGKTYTGVCVGGPLSVCAEQIALGAMLTAGERHFESIVAVWKDNHGQAFILPPCGRCREFMRMLDQGNLEADVVLGRDHVEKLHTLLPFPYWHAENAD
jgi:lincosamide nucleotidyltransferase A/C/D/E